MKKFFVSSIVIISFIAYSMYQKATGVNAMPVISAKQDLSQTTISTPTLMPSPTDIPTITSAPTNQPKVSQPTSTPIPSSGYKDGTYTGSVADAFYGNIQVQAIIANGKITNVQFLQYPSDRGTSIYINQQADPILAQEAIQAQSANVDIVSGATDSSMAFRQSLQAALDNAKA